MLQNILLGYANEIFLAFTLPIIGFLAMKLRAIANAKVEALSEYMDEESRKRLVTALNNVITAAENAGKAQDLNSIADYLKTMNPGDLKRLGLDNPAKLTERILTAIDARGSK